MKQFPAPRSHKLCVSLCGLSPLSPPRRCLKASALGPLGMTCLPGRDGMLVPSRQADLLGEQHVSPCSLCAGARLEAVIVCRLLLKLKVYENKNRGIESENAQTLVSLLTKPSSYCGADCSVLKSSVYSLLLCVSSQAPHKIHTSQSSTAWLSEPRPLGFTLLCVCICVWNNEWTLTRCLPPQQRYWSEWSRAKLSKSI